MDPNKKNNISVDLDRTKLKLWCELIEGSVRVMRASLTEWTGKKKNIYREEKMMLQKHLNSLYTGVFTTLFLFSFRRIGRSNWFNRFRMEQLAESVAETSTSARITASKIDKSSPAFERLKQIENVKLHETKNMLFEKMEIPIDIMTSSFSGCVLFLVLQKSNDFTADAIAVPLVAGGSLVHKHACQDLVQLYINEGNDQLFDHVADKNDEITLRWFQQIVKNCQLRSEHIQARKLAGIQQPEMYHRKYSYVLFWKECLQSDCPHSRSILFNAYSIGSSSSLSYSWNGIDGNTAD
jgi:hypothetical protein